MPSENRFRRALLWDGDVPARPSRLGGDFAVAAFFFYDEARLRARAGAGASGPAAPPGPPERFTVLHRIDAHVLVPVR
jgi:hypothetical protein